MSPDFVGANLTPHPDTSQNLFAVTGCGVNSDIQVSEGPKEQANLCLR